MTFRQLALLSLLSAGIAIAGALTVSRFAADEGGALSSAPAVERVAIADPTVATDEQNNIDIYRSIGPGVVNVTTTAVIETFFGAYPQKGSGSGSIIDSDGHILTNFHVIREGAAEGGRSSIEVALADKSTFTARVVGVDPDHDLAVLKIDAPRSKLAVVPLGSSSDLLVGQKVLAIGNPFGLQQTLTTGVISALERPLVSPSRQQIAGVIQTDAAINPGNSGGPLLNSRGEMIGINTAIFSDSGGNVGIGFAVPVDTAKRIVPELIRSGRVARPYIGTGFQRLDRRVARLLNLDPEVQSGLVIVSVEPGSPAARAGIRGVTQRGGRYVAGDIMLSADGRETKEEADLSLVLNSKRPGEPVQLELLREGRRVSMQVILGEAPSQRISRED